MTATPEPGPEECAKKLYLIWVFLGLTILAAFAVLLFLQRKGRVEIADAGGTIAPEVHMGLAAALFLAAAALVGALRSRARDPDRLVRGTRARTTPSQRARAPEARTAAGGSSPIPERSRASHREPSSVPPGAASTRPARALIVRFTTLSVLAWTVALVLALAGFGLALVLAPAPRLAIITCFTGALFLWLWSRPALEGLAEGLRRARAEAFDQAGESSNPPVP